MKTISCSGSIAKKRSDFRIIKQTFDHSGFPLSSGKNFNDRILVFHFNLLIEQNFKSFHCVKCTKLFINYQINY